MFPKAALPGRRRGTPCKPGTLRQVARQMAEVHAELLLVHPFREGNGRLTRWLADLMALQAGVSVPDYQLSGPKNQDRRASYLAAVTQGYLMRYEGLEAFFLEPLERGGEAG